MFLQSILMYLPKFLLLFFYPSKISSILFSVRYTIQRNSVNKVIESKCTEKYNSQLKPQLHFGKIGNHPSSHLNISLFGFSWRDSWWATLHPYQTHSGLFQQLLLTQLKHDGWWIIFHLWREFCKMLKPCKTEFHNPTF